MLQKTPIFKVLNFYKKPLKFLTYKNFLRYYKSFNVTKIAPGPNFPKYPLISLLQKLVKIT